MFKIGELSELCGVSVKTIRYYEEEGLISPVEVDRWTNYRYYDETSINRLSQIVYLKDLGFSLKEIKNLDDEIIKEKIKTLQADIVKLTKSIHTLSNIKKVKGEFIMKNFINDERVIGKWQKIGNANSLEDLKKGKIEDSKIFIFDELYFLPNGQPYWSLAWTKGTLFVNNQPMPYQIIDNKLVVGVVDYYSKEINEYAVYEQVDNKEYKESDIRVKDNTDIPFINDDRLIGFWESVDFIEKVDEFNPENRYWRGDLFVKKYAVEPNGNLTVTYNNGNSRNLKWSKGFVIDNVNSTTSAYTIKTINNEDYLIIEWKSGDYIYGGFIAGNYVLKKIK